MDDNLTTWSPKALGILRVPFTGEYKLTETEGRLLDRLSVDRGLLGLNTFNNIKDQAFSVSESLYPPPSPNNIPGRVPQDRQGEWINNDGHHDAFQHAYWNALLTKEFGQNWTKE